MNPSVTIIFILLFFCGIVALVESSFLRDIARMARSLRPGQRFLAVIGLFVAVAYGGTKPAPTPNAEPRFPVDPSSLELSSAAILESQVITEARSRVACGLASFDDYVVARIGLPGPVSDADISAARQLLLQRVQAKLEAP